MSGVKAGIDKLGRHYKTVNGKRVVTGVADEGQAHPHEEHAGSSGNPSHDAIKKYLTRSIHSGSHSEVTKAIEHLLNRRFGLWFMIAAKTSAGKAARLYAARQMLDLLKGGNVTTEDEKKLADMAKGDHFDSAAFRAAFVPAVQAEEQPATTDSAAGSVNDDAAILAVVHRYGLKSQQLAAILERSLKS